MDEIIETCKKLQEGETAVFTLLDPVPHGFLAALGVKANSRTDNCWIYFTLQGNELTAECQPTRKLGS